MARIRSIKPEFFTDEDIARLDPLYRLAFVGLWCQADRAGRLEDRPARLKVQVLPYDTVDFEEVLNALVGARFVQRFTGPDGRAYLQVRTFEEHQRPRDDEAESKIPVPPPLTETVQSSLLDSDEPVTTQSVGKERKGNGKEGSTSFGLKAEDVVSVWNTIVTPPIPKVDKLTPDRRMKINARLKAFPAIGDWQTAITWVNGQDWCRAPGTGNNPKWTATLDWLVKNDSWIQRAIEHAHSERPSLKSAPPTTQAERTTQQLLASVRQPVRRPE